MTSRPLRILAVHTRYLVPGGEDRVFDLDTAGLREAGHDVDEYVRDNADLGTLSAGQLAATVRWNPEAHDAVRDRIRANRPDVVHVHNTFPLLSGSVVHAARDAGVPVVATLHNYRYFCLNGVAVRRDRPCHDCLGRSAWRGVLHRCYRDGMAASFAAWRALRLQRSRGTWTEAADRLIAPSRHARDTALRAGLPAERVVVRGHRVPDPGAPAPDRPRRHLLYAGRLSPEKGVGVLLEALRRLTPRPRTILAGTGPLEEAVRACGMPEVEAAGQRTPGEIADLMRDASLVVAPSVAPETFGLSVVEAFASGAPCVVTDHGALAELVDEGRTGARVPAGDAGALAETLRRLIGDPEALGRMGAAARETYLADHAPEAATRALVDLYREVAR